MKVAVLMSTYNGQEFLEKQINSILSQQDVEITLIVRDDGSTDKTTDILDRYQKQGDLQWYSGANLKPAKSFMELLANCGEFDYYSFSDQDDIWDENKLSVAVSVLNKYKKPALYFCNSRLIDAEENELGMLTYHVNSNRNVEKNNLLCELCSGGAMGCTMVMNHSLVSLIQNHEKPNNVIMHDCYIQALCKAIGGITVFDPNPHMSYRQHGSNVVGRKAGLMNAIKYRIDFLTADRKVSIADQAEYIYREYYDLLPAENISLVKQVAQYKDSLYKRIKLGFNNQMKLGISKNNLFIRLSIIMGKR